MKIEFQKTPAVFILILTLMGCQATGPDHGGHVTSGVNQGNDKKISTAFGLMAGSFIGPHIGQYLDEQDLQRMVLATNQTVASGQGQKWLNPKSKSSGETRVISTITKASPVKIKVLKKRIAEIPSLAIIGQTYRALKKSNVRAGPGLNHEIVDGLSIGEIVNAVGKVSNSNWYLISQDGIGRGFIYAPLLEYAPAEATVSSGTSIAQSDIIEKNVTSSLICRTIEQSLLLADGSSYTDTIEACQSTSGWVVKT